MHLGNYTESMRSAPFWEKVQRGASDVCWEWQASFKGAGYGAFGWEGHVWMAHRFAWCVTFGLDIPEEILVCHRCDNPKCCNPSHLFLGTVQDNKDDEMAKRRHAFGTRNANAKLTEDQVRAIRATPLSNRLASQQFGVAPSMISMIKTRTLWKHLP